MTDEAHAATARRAHPAGLPEPGRCLVMGVVNVTPDSFSDGGLWLEPGAAVAQGLRLVEQGADIVDVGGESTRPGAQRVDATGGIAPDRPGYHRAGRGRDRAVSVDTTRAARWPSSPSGPGARMVNDVSGGLADPEMPRLMAGAGVPYVGHALARAQPGHAGPGHLR